MNNYDSYTITSVMLDSISSIMKKIGKLDNYKELNRMETAEIMAVYGRTDLLFSDCDVMDIENKTGCLISKGLAFRLFGGTDVMGNVLEYNSRGYEIIDVIESDIPLFVYELWEEDSSIVLDRATMICVQNSPKQTKAAYDKVAGMWSLVDYQMIFYGIKIVYFIVPWILGAGYCFPSEGIRIQQGNQL